MQANEKQVAGTHYKSQYQHWDFVMDTKQNYLQGCATKYISRHRKKNGVEDLKKAQHYVEKLLELDLAIRVFDKTYAGFQRFVTENKLKIWESSAIKEIIDGRFYLALEFIEKLILEYEIPHEDTTGMQAPFGFDAAGESK